MTKILTNQLVRELKIGKIPYRIAKKYNVSQSAISQRIKKLVAKGVLHKSFRKSYWYVDYSKIPKKFIKKAWSKTYYEKHKEEIKEIKEKYGQTKKGKAAATVHALRRYKRRYGILHDFKTKDWLEKLKESFGVCPRCNKYVGIKKLTLDHIYPLSKAIDIPNFIYTIDDVQPLCKPCNIDKRDKIEGISYQNLNHTN